MTPSRDDLWIQRYVDGELSADDAADFSARLLREPELRARACSPLACRPLPAAGARAARVRHASGTRRRRRARTLKMLRGELAPERHAPRRSRGPLLEHGEQLVEHMAKVEAATNRSTRAA